MTYFTAISHYINILFSIIYYQVQKGPLRFTLSLPLQTLATCSFFSLFSTQGYLITYHCTTRGSNLFRREFLPFFISIFGSHRQDDCNIERSFAIQLAGNMRQLYYALLLMAQGLVCP